MTMTAMSDAIEQLSRIVNAYENDEPVNVSDYELAAETTQHHIDTKGWLIKNLENQVKLLKERSEELKKKATNLESFGKNLKHSLVYLMDRNPHLDFSGQAWKMKVVNNGGKQAVTLAFGLDFHEVKKIVDPAYFPLDCTEAMTVHVLKEGTEDRVRNGEHIEGLELQPRGRSLRIS